MRIASELLSHCHTLYLNLLPYRPRYLESFAACLTFCLLASLVIGYTYLSSIADLFLSIIQASDYQPQLDNLVVKLSTDRLTNPNHNHPT